MNSNEAAAHLIATIMSENPTKTYAEARSAASATVSTTSEASVGFALSARGAGKSGGQGGPTGAPATLSMADQTRHLMKEKGISFEDAQREVSKRNRGAFVNGLRR